LIARRANRERVGSLSSDPAGLKWSEVPNGKLPVLMTVKPWLLRLTWNRQIGAEEPTELKLTERLQQRRPAIFRLLIPRVAKEGNDVAIVARNEEELVKLRKSIGRRIFWFSRKESRKFQDSIWFVPESELKKVCPDLDAIQGNARTVGTIRISSASAAATERLSQQRDPELGEISEQFLALALCGAP
jgi:hypothetical protein